MHFQLYWFFMSFIVVKSQTRVSFCDGDDFYSFTEGECEGGFKFGARKPDCVCISGVYRSWSEDCSLFDGFIHEFCSSVSDDAYNVKWLKVLPGIRNIYKDTAAVFGKHPSDDQSWTTYLIGMGGWTKSDSFYTLNGNPVVLSNGKERFICVEPRHRPTQQVCRFFSYENKGVWVSENMSMKIKVMHSCKGDSNELKGYKMEQLKHDKCYDVMNNTVSECKLSCKNERPMPTLELIREKKNVKPSDFNGSDTTDSTTPSPKNKTAKPFVMKTIQGISSEAREIKSNANFAFHRKINKYIMLRQVGLIKPPDLTRTPPSRTFTLLEIVKRVVRNAIPSTFVSTVFLDNALDLFVFLHKGQDFRYMEDIPSRDFKMIEEVLLRCTVGVIENPIKFQGNTHLPGCERDGLVENVCQISDGAIAVCQKMNGGKFHHGGKFHYAIEAVWNMVDMAHVLCQPFFQTSYRMFHQWEQASEKLFTREMRELWYKPEVDLRVYDAILSSQAVSNMINLERCTEGAYRLSTLPRLRRPPLQKSNFRRKRDVATASVARSVDVFCLKNDFDIDC